MIGESLTLLGGLSLLYTRYLLNVRNLTFNAHLQPDMAKRTCLAYKTGNYPTPSENRSEISKAQQQRYSLLLRDNSHAPTSYKGTAREQDAPAGTCRQLCMVNSLQQQ